MKKTKEEVEKDARQMGFKCACGFTIYPSDISIVRKHSRTQTPTHPHTHAYTHKKGSHNTPHTCTRSVRRRRQAIYNRLANTRKTASLTDRPKYSRAPSIALPARYGRRRVPHIIKHIRTAAHARAHARRADVTNAKALSSRRHETATTHQQPARRRPSPFDAIHWRQLIKHK